MLSCTSYQQTAPNETEDGGKWVTVLDPTHFLFGRRFRLLSITPHTFLGICCQVEWEGADYFIPLGSTDQSPNPVLYYPLPLNVTAVHQLVTISIHLGVLPGEDSDHETELKQERGELWATLARGTAATGANLVRPDGAPTGNDFSGADASLSELAHPPVCRDQGGGR